MKFKEKDLEIQTARTMVLIVHSRTFGILLKMILAMIPKPNLTLVICSHIIQIYKNNLGQEAIVLRV
jgi:hypothetical protein